MLQKTTTPSASKVAGEWFQKFELKSWEGQLFQWPDTEGFLGILVLSFYLTRKAGHISTNDDKVLCLPSQFYKKINHVIFFSPYK